MKNSYSILIALFIVGSTFAQSPEQMSYQATVSDATGSLVTNQQVGVQISILQTTVGGTAVYVETQTTTTNANGLVSIAIGTGTPVNGTFATIDWSADTYFIKTETDPTGGTSYSLINTSQLLSVPYALYAKTATTAITAANGIPAGGTNAQVLQIVEGVPTWITFSLFYKDTDGDSYGDINSAIGAGAAPNGYIANNTDCNDTDFNEYPGQTWYIDADADGYGSTSIVACARAINGFLLSELLGNGTDDCDDTDPLVKNTNQTWYVDADGDNFGGSSVVACARAVNGFLLSELSGSGTDDCDDTDPLVNNPNQTWYVDADGDNFGGSSVVACARVPNGFLLSELLGSGTDDCDDTDPTINPTTVWYADLDGDGYGDATSSETGCTSTLTNATQDNTDCSDGNPDEYPGQTWYIDADGDNFGGSSVVACARVINGFLLSELSGSGTDDCDDTDPLVNNTNQTWYVDADGDNFGGSSVVACARVINGFLLSELSGSGTDDCDDTDPLVNNTNQTWYVDADGDNFGGSSVVACARVPNGFLLSELLGNGTDDCNDGDPDEYPGQTWYIDLDGDDFGGSSVVACARVINGFLLSELLGNGTDDCDDTDPDEYPGQTWYIDADGDNFGGSSVVACARVVNGFLLSELLGSGTADCNDSDSTLNPVSVWYADLDGDGYGDATSSEIGCTSALTNATLDNTDCNDGDPAIYPGRREIAGDGIDNNCDGRVDELDIGQFLGGGIVFWVDPTDNTRSLVCAYDDQSAGIQWYNGYNTEVYYTETAIKTGASNTKFIIDYQGPTATNYAAGIAEAYGNNYNWIFDDWYLPSKDALNEMYLNKTAINAALTALGGDVLSGSYWSSSEVNSELAWGQSFVDGNQGEYVKYFGGKVRAVREYPNYIGQIMDDGVVFYLTDNATTDLDGDGDYDLGLICAFSDYPVEAEWGCYGTDLTNVPNDGGNPVGLGTVIGDGMWYTNNILQWGCSTGSAAVAARFLGPNWFLPSAKELNEMYLNKATLELVPGFTAFSNAYWSSSEFDSSDAWYQYFPTGDQFKYYKGFTANVRAVRAF